VRIADSNRRSAPRPPSSGVRWGWLRDERGAAAAELALIAPIGFLILGLLTLGGQGFELQGKVALAAHTVTDLVAKSPYVPNLVVSGATELNQSALDTDLALSSEILYPNSATTLSAVVSELLVNSTSSEGVVVWSEAYNGGTPLAVGTLVPLGSSITGAGGSYLVYGQVWYTYKPVTITHSLGSITLSGSEMLIPRNATQITINWGQ